ncbi:MAG: hypothetical protein ACP5RD_07885 [bacterium]
MKIISIIINLLKKVSRRTIFLIVALILTLSIISSNISDIQKLNLYILSKSISWTSERAYNYIENLEEGSVVLLSADYAPSTKVENDPVVQGFLTQAFRKNLKVIAISLWPDGAVLVENNIKMVASKMNKKEDQDFVIGGYVVGGTVAIEKMGINLKAAIPLLKNSNAPFLKNIKTAKDLKLVFSVAAGDSLQAYIKILGARYRVPVSGGCTAVMAAEMYPYIISNQLIGLFAGLKGACDYQILELKDQLDPNNVPEAVKNMFPQSIIHLLIVIFIVIANLVYFYERYEIKSKAKK